MLWVFKKERTQTVFWERTGKESVAPDVLRRVYRNKFSEDVGTFCRDVLCVFPIGENFCPRALRALNGSPVSMVLASCE